MLKLQSLLAAGALLAAALPAWPQEEASRYESFPASERFRPLIADPAEPRVFVTPVKITRQPSGAEFNALSAGVGYDFGLLRRKGRRPDDGWQVSVFGSVDSLFNLDLPGDALVNTDYRVGIPLAYRSGDFTLRARAYHQSSHLGDELILGGNAPRRLDLSFEVIDLLLAWDFGGWRAYGGGGAIVRSSLPDHQRILLQLGFDYTSPTPLAGTMRLVGGIDAKWLEQADWRSGVSLKVGALFGRSKPGQRGMTVLLEAYEGFSPFGQFFVEDVKYYGAGLQFDF